MTSVSESPIHSALSQDNFETYSLIWLDAKVNCHSSMETRSRFRSFINYLQAFECVEHCEHHIRSTGTHDRVILVINSDYAQALINKIHSLQQIFSIYIHSLDRQRQQEWTRSYYKIRGIYEGLPELINEMQRDHSRRREERIDEPISISIFDKNKEHGQSTTGLDGHFLHYQLLILCLLRMESTSLDKNEFISKCREMYKDNSNQLKIIDEFENEYSPKLSLRWYTRETFLYRLLNKALRIQNIDLLFLFRFFIHDIEKELEQRRHPSRVRVYRGQLMSTDELNALKRSTGKFISINSFFSTSSNRAMALHYLGSQVTDERLHRILFEIDADPNKEGVKPFADLSSLSYFPEDEFLMALGSVFCVNQVYLGEQQIWFIEMSLHSNSDGDLRDTISHMHSQYNSENQGLLLLGSHLIDMANFQDAEKYFSRLLKQLSSKHPDMYKCYHALSKVSFEKGDYDLSLEYLHKALKTFRKGDLHDSRIGYIYNSMGEAYQAQGDIQRALEAYQMALMIFEKTFARNDENLAWCYNNIGMIYTEHQCYHIARGYLLQALQIKRRFLPAKHPCLGNTYNNLGNVHYYLREYDQALANYQLTYEIFHKSLTFSHPSIARTLRNIGVAYEAKGDHAKALKHYQKAAAIRENIMLATHPDMKETRNDIKRLTLKLHEVIKQTDELTL